MYKEHKIICIIPARGGSKGLPRKNVLKICGKSLIAYTIEQALASKYIDTVLVSTEDEEIAKIAKSCGGEVPFMRPMELAQDDTPVTDALLHGLKWFEDKGQNFDIVVMLHTTSPLRAVEDIDSCIVKLVEEKADNVFSVTDSYRNPYFNMVEIVDGKVVQVKTGNYPSRQSAPPVYDLNASVYVWWKDVLKKKPGVYYENSKVYLMPRERSVDIDDEIDFELVKLLMEKKLGLK
ncbi:MAG: acylneuraminate cytidylyltransferase family protein [Sedimentisphaerales bacterium]|nr:acylneuraminate cytidylyltransferase family protein [Sedimentisphaerales bacterium]